jgi:hypothetical protein
MAYISFQPKDYFNTKLYTGNGGNQTITGVGFKPDWTWFKSRDAGNSHALVDIVRGTTKVLYSDTNSTEQTISAQTFNSDGFALVQDGGANSINSNGSTKVAWSWRASGTSGSSNTDGSTTSTVSANTTAGFSIVKYTNPSSGSPFTVGHGLGSPPKVIMVKNITGSAQNWGVWHTGIGFGKYLQLNTTIAEASANLVTATSNTTFSTYSDHHTSGVDLIAYCFAEKKGFSRFGSYVGNGSVSGPFIYTGFKPAFFLWKRSNSTGGWYQMDSVRDTYNPVEKTLGANDSSAESAFGTGNDTDFFSNGLKIRSTGGDINTSGGTYIYMAFAEEPLVSSNGVPNTAR